MFNKIKLFIEFVKEFNCNMFELSEQVRILNYHLYSTGRYGHRNY